MRLIEQNGTWLDADTGEILSLEQVALCRLAVEAADLYRLMELVRGTVKGMKKDIDALIKVQFPKFEELDNELFQLEKAYEKAQEAMRQQALLAYQAQEDKSQKSFFGGAISIRLSQRMTRWDEAMAVAYAEEMKRPELLTTVPNKKKFEALAKVGGLPTEVMTIETVAETAVSVSALAELGYKGAE